MKSKTTRNICDFVDNASQFTYASAYGCTFRGNTAYNTLVTAGGDYKLVGCKFISNTNNQQTIYSADGDLIVEDCEFNDNAAPVCCRSSNTSGKQNDVVISGCKFVGNKSILVSAGNDTGTNPLNGMITVTNCLFSGNTASIDLPGHYSSSGGHPKVLILGSFGIADKCVVRDSEIVGTRTADSLFGQCALYGARAVRCTFSYDADALPGFSPASTKYNEAAEASVLEECDISSGELRDCIVDRCTIHDITNKAYAIFKDKVRVTNTLVRCCKNSGGFYSAPNKLDAEFVNCTIVSNDVVTFDFQGSRSGRTVGIWEEDPTMDAGLAFSQCVNYKQCDLDFWRIKWERVIEYTFDWKLPSPDPGLLEVKIYTPVVNIMGDHLRKGSDWNTRFWLSPRDTRYGAGLFSVVNETKNKGEKTL